MPQRSCRFAAITGFGQWRQPLDLCVLLHGADAKPVNHIGSRRVVRSLFQVGQQLQRSGRHRNRERRAAEDPNAVDVILERRQIPPVDDERERRTGRELLLSFGLLFGTKDGVCSLNSNNPCEKCIDCMTYGYAAGGGGATDNTVLNLGRQIAGRTEYESLLDMYKGENAAIGLEDAANAAIYQGKVAERGAQYKAAGYGYQTQGTLAQSAGSMAQQFGSLVSGVAGLGTSFDKLNLGGGTSFMPSTGNVGWATPKQRR